MTKATEKYTLAGISLSKQYPTKLSFHDLYTWVIWQFPKHKTKGLCGAVRPPIPEHGWFPAIILVQEKCVEIHAHQDVLYASPEMAAGYFSNGKLPEL